MRLKKCFEVMDMIRKHEFLDEITETRTGCGFRENMIQESTKPYDDSRLQMAWLIHSWILYPRMYEFLDEITETRTGCGFRENMIHSWILYPRMYIEYKM